MKTLCLQKKTGKRPYLIAYTLFFTLKLPEGLNCELGVVSNEW